MALITTKGADISPVPVEFNLGKSLDEKVQLFGEGVTNSLADKQLVVAVQALVRRLAKLGKTGDEIQAAVTAWKPGVTSRVAAGDPLVASLQVFEGMSPEGQDDYIEKLEAARSAKGKK